MEIAKADTTAEKVDLPHHFARVPLLDSVKTMAHVVQLHHDIGILPSAAAAAERTGRSFRHSIIAGISITALAAVPAHAMHGGRT